MEQLATELAKFGLPGIVILVCVFAIRVLWNDNKELTRLLFATTEKTSAAIEANTAALNRVTETINTRRKDL